MSNRNKIIIYGKGVNDSDTPVKPVVNGKRVYCPYYEKWHGMLERCYSKKFHVKRPSYIDCTVCDEWLLFSRFREWMKKHDWHGKELDKDILLPMNNLYSPETCIFVDQRINTLFGAMNNSRSPWPVGVTWRKRDKKFYARCSRDKSLMHIGAFNSVKDAHTAYLKCKSEIFRDESISCNDARVSEAFIREAEKMELQSYGFINN